MTSPILDAVDKAQRLRRIMDAVGDVAWLQDRYPFEQHGQFNTWLMMAKICLEQAKTIAQSEVD